MNGCEVRLTVRVAYGVLDRTLCRCRLEGTTFKLHLKSFLKTGPVWALSPLAASFSRLSKPFIRAEVPTFFRIAFYFRVSGIVLYPNHNIVPGDKKMRRRCLCSLFLVALVLALQGCAGLYFHKAAYSPSPPRSLTLSDNPIREYWTGIVFNGSKIGFSHFRLASAAEEENRFDIQSEAYFRIRFLMLEKKINLRRVDRVADDLSLIRFDYAFDIDGNHLSLNGQRLANQLTVTVRSQGESTPQVLPLETHIYPASAIGLYPFLHGLAVGRRYHYTVYDGQTQKLAPVVQEILAYEESELFRGPAFKIRTRFLGGTVTTWMNDRGESLLETSLNGVVISVLESENVPANTSRKRPSTKTKTCWNSVLLNVIRSSAIQTGFIR